MSIRQLAKVSAAFCAASLLVACGVSNNPPAQNMQASSAPTVVMVAPQENGVATNREIGVVFDKKMDPASINSATFVVPGVSGAVTYDATNKIAAFKPSSDFAANTAYKATLTTGCTDIDGIALAAPFTFSFTTRGTKDTSPPEVSAVNVAGGATCVPLDQKIKVAFNEPMDSLTITPSTFFIDGVAGAVTYDAGSQTATFTPSSPLAPNTTYTITVTTGVKDMGGVALAADYHQTFTTGPCQGGGGPPVPLCPFIGKFSVLAGSTVTNTGSTVIAGDVGLSPGSSVTGFPPGTLVPPGTIHIADGAAGNAQTALTNAYNDAAGRKPPTKIVSGDLVGQTLVAGIYKSTSSLAATGNVTLDAQGNSAAIFIFQIASTLTTGSGSQIVLINGAKACNVFWQVGTSATLGTHSIFKGNILALTSITVTTGVNLEGRALARNGAVTLDTNVIGGCVCGP